MYVLEKVPRHLQDKITFQSNSITFAVHLLASHLPTSVPPPPPAPRDIHITSHQLILPLCLCKSSFFLSDWDTQLPSLLLQHQITNRKPTHQHHPPPHLNPHSARPTRERHHRCPRGGRRHGHRPIPLPRNRLIHHRTRIPNPSSPGTQRQRQRRGDGQIRAAAGRELAPTGIHDDGGAVADAGGVAQASAAAGGEVLRHARLGAGGVVAVVGGVFAGDGGGGGGCGGRDGGGDGGGVEGVVGVEGAAELLGEGLGGGVVRGAAGDFFAAGGGGAVGAVAEAGGVTGGGGAGAGL